MGIEDRDYLREEDRPTFGASFAGGQAVKWIIIANVAVFVLQLLTDQSATVTRAFEMAPGDILQRFQLWRLVTYAFCHDPHGLSHIFWNMYVLYLVGPRMESRVGTREFFWFYFTAVVASGLMYVLLALVLRQVSPVIGASGAVTAVFIVYALHYPREIWRLLFIIPVEVRWLCLAKIAFDLHPVLLAFGGAQMTGGVAYTCHLGGWVFGFLYDRNRWQLSNLFGGVKVPSLPRRPRKSHLKVFDPQRDSTEIEIRMDAILQKIHDQGESSLTDEERALLTEASRRLRNRTRS